MEQLDLINKKYKKNSLNFLNFKQIKHFGVPNNCAPVIAYHSIHCILAIGTQEGKIKL